jgi:hypothetical protein
MSDLNVEEPYSDVSLQQDQFADFCLSAGQQLQLQLGGDVEAALGSGCPTTCFFSDYHGLGGSSGAAGQSHRPGSSYAVPNKGSSRAKDKATRRTCTSLAQREAHKRYRERKKQSVSVGIARSTIDHPCCCLLLLSKAAALVPHAQLRCSIAATAQLQPQDCVTAQCLTHTHTYIRHCPALLQIAAMEAAVELKRTELQQLQAENEQLKSRARVLQTAERCSVEIHELMLLLDGLQVRLTPQACGFFGERSQSDDQHCLQAECMSFLKPLLAKWCQTVVLAAGLKSTAAMLQQLC